MHRVHSLELYVQLYHVDLDLLDLAEYFPVPDVVRWWRRFLVAQLASQLASQLVEGWRAPDALLLLITRYQ